jgi:hypothetical protein
MYILFVASDWAGGMLLLIFFGAAGVGLLFYSASWKVIALYTAVSLISLTLFLMLLRLAGFLGWL